MSGKFDFYLSIAHDKGLCALVKRCKYEDLDELTPYALRELVKAIYIEAPDKSSGKRHQGIRISYDLVGFIPVEELLKQETA